jgi:two-component system response regulator NreC
VMRRLRNSAHQTRFVMMSATQDLSLVVRSFREGATAFVHKSADRDCLVAAIHAAAENRRFVSPPFSMDDIDDSITELARTSQGSAQALSPREREIVQLVVLGYSSRQIGENLSISPRTVEVHRAKLMRKLNLRRKADLIRYAVREGLVTLDS